ncbi:hypothetical protein K3495_g51 [Podosphaera aphanis]|nr:hypothetical protein K3495_g51 [Podosphaera aphanis]
MADPSTPETTPETTHAHRRRLATATELNLKANRKMASTALEKSRQQERIYVTQKKADFGRQEAKKAKIHFSNAQRNLLQGLACSGQGLACLPAMLQQKFDGWQQQRMVKQAAAAQRKLDGMNIKRAGTENEAENGTAST